MENIGEQFLHQKDSKLHTSEHVEHENKRKKPEVEKVSKKPREKIADWMSVLERTHVGHRETPEVWQRIKNYYHDEHVIKPGDIQESVFLLEQRIAREMGYGDIEITEEFRDRKINQIISDQKESLDRWLDYLASQDATYPMWAKYWAFTSLVQMGKFEKAEEEKDGHKVESGRFARRTKDTTSPFPTLNPRALAMTIGVMQSRLEEAQKDKDDKKEVENKSTKLNNSDFQKLLSTENFSKIYTQFLIEMPEYSTEGLQETRGKWVKYERHSDPKPLVDSIQGYPLEWCTANMDTARTQLEGGDFYVYYSLDSNGEPTIPRLAIRMQEESIAEVRGIAPDQNIDLYISDVAKEKMKEFPDGSAYEKKSVDMKRLTEIDKKTKNGTELTKEDLEFLYETNSTIEGFGYRDDPRIEEIRGKRETKADYAKIFDCREEDIVVGRPDLIKDTTKVYSFGQGNIDYKALSLLKPDMKVYAELPNKPIEFIDPKNVDYKKLVDEPNVYKNGTQTINPEMLSVDIEKAKAFIPDMKEFVGKPLHEVMKYVADTYGSKYRIAGLEYREFLRDNPGKAPQELKDTNLYFFFFGSVFRGSDGVWNVPYSDWDGRVFHRNVGWLGRKWNSRYRLVLLEI